MAIGEVGVGSQRATVVNEETDPLTLAFPANVKSGSLLIAAGSARKLGESPMAIVVTDTLGTTYTVFTAAPDANITLFLAYGISTSAGADTVTVNPAPVLTSYISFSIDEFSGVDASNPLDVDGGSSTGTSTSPQDSLTTTKANSLLVGVMLFSDQANETITPGATYTQIGEEQDGSLHAVHNAEFRIASSVQAYVVDWSLGSSRPWMAYTAAFNEATDTISIQVSLGSGGMIGRRYV